MQVYFLFKPNLVVLHGFSACAHFVLLLVMSVAWVCNRLKVNSHECTEQRLKDNAKFLLYIPTLLSCLGMSLFHLILSVLNYFYWYRDGWSESSENYLAIQFDLVLRTLAWFVVCGYLRACLSYSSEKKYPIFPRIWWGFYFLLSCSCLALDIVLYTQHKCYLPTHFWVLDIGSVLPGSFLCYIGLFGGRNRENTIPLQEPLLNGVGGSSNGNGIRNVSPYSSAGLLSLLTFSWISPLISLGNKKTLDPNDLPEIAEIGSANRIFPIFINKLESYCGSDNESNGVGSLLLLKALILSMWKEILYSAFFALVNTISSYVGPYLMETFIQYLHDRGNSTLKGCLLVSVFLVAKLVECLSQGQLHFWADRFGMQGHTALVALIYKKLLSLSSRAKQDYTSGEIVNLMSVDTERIGEFSWYAIRLCLVPFQIGVAMFILYRSMGPASFITLAAAMTIMVGNIPVGRLQQKFQLGMMEAKDERMKSTAEILRNMRVLKLQAWEMRFLSQIYELRKKEENLLRKYLYTSVVEVFLFCGVPAFMAAISFLSCIPLGIPLTSGRILSALATFRYLQVPIDELPAIITMFAQMKISLNRIVSFLCLEDLHPDILEKLPRGSSKVSVEIINGNFSWDLSYANPTLRNLNLRVYNGMKVAICGTVGSGKSSLLSCILGEVPRLSGTVTLAGSKVYVSQSSWIQGGTIEYNILFGKEMDREKYEQVLEVCSLKSDIEVLDFGDQTIIGERGINPSGGQKQRIQIARALYQDADIYLFDDPFSAVDAYTGTHLFKRCLLGLLGSKTVIYVTHQVEFLPYADLILLMNDGMITQAGKYDDILISGSDFVELISAHEKALRAIDSTKSTCPNQVENEENLHYFVENCKKGKLRKDGVNSEFDEIVVPKVQFVQEEDGGKGKVGMSIYWTYITTSYRGALIPCILLAQILFQFLQIGSTYWVAGTFPASEDKRTPTGGLFLIQYVALALGSSVCILVADLLQAISGYKTATLLFKKMHNCVFRAPMSFFDSTSSACILNRASIDQSEVDESIPNLIKWFAFSTIQLLGTVIMMSQVYWHVFIIFVLMISISIWYQKQHQGQLQSGVLIRNRDSWKQNLKLINSYQQPNLYRIGAMLWLFFRLDILSLVMFTFALVLLITLPGVIDPIIAGLAVMYGLTLNMLQEDIIFTLCDLENKIVSVERILQYACIPHEPPPIIEGNRPDPNWPSCGEVEIQNLQVRYAPHLAHVLCGITCTFNGGENIGIVGRTGSGKSTLIHSLFRLVDPTCGQILIDGIDIRNIGLQDLRSRLSIIPQDPTMFKGTLRSNLDPLGEYTDQQIWEALDKCQLGEEIRKKEEKLDSEVVENGENWSLGRRQLVCLGRVLLKQSKILVLDEATASLDTATDSLIQRTIRDQFSGSTVISVAHRIDSVLDSDMILLLDQGLIVEYDHPRKLLKNKSSAFTKLVAEYTLRVNLGRNIMK